jgi:DNA-binding CsgD family transcriptional regulator
MILARFHAVPMEIEPTQISMIVGLLEPFSMTQHQAGTHAPTNFQFTEREQACVTHLIQGMTDKEIARQLGLSEYTVKDHFRHVRKKTGAMNRGGIISRVLGRADVHRNGSPIARAIPPVKRDFR